MTSPKYETMNLTCCRVSLLFWFSVTNSVSVKLSDVVNAEKDIRHSLHYICQVIIKLPHTELFGSMQFNVPDHL
ncbi:hypothetical protein ATANTOWER_023287 [Ataeniobius toweri]|uniref:Secreted protein n=1 Tax=Ataeniobius toweri TaxID=208326 RepID=A0ABU7AQP1_9TELE|nr:hypothetical protein [Ataeniobius toweri]